MKARIIILLIIVNVCTVCANILDLQKPTPLDSIMWENQRRINYYLDNKREPINAVIISMVLPGIGNYYAWDEGIMPVLLIFSEVGIMLHLTDQLNLYPSKTIPFIAIGNRVIAGISSYLSAKKTNKTLLRNLQINRNYYLHRNYKSIEVNF